MVTICVGRPVKEPGSLSELFDQQRPTDPLARMQSWPPVADNVNTIFANRRFYFHKLGELFVVAHNETLFVAAMRVSDPDGSRCLSLPAPALLTVQNRLRCGFVQFKSANRTDSSRGELRAHLL